MSVNAFSVSGSQVFAGSGREGVYTSSDEGQTWISFNNGLSNTWIHALLCTTSEILTGTEGGGVFSSAMNSPFWESINEGLHSSRITAFAENGTNIFSATWGGGIFTSSDNGANWISASTGISNPFITSLIIAGNSIFAGTRGTGVFSSSDNGDTWSSVDNGLNNPYITELILDDNVLCAGTMDGIYHSDDLGNNWFRYNPGPAESNIISLVADGLKIFAGTPGEGIYCSLDEGASWSQRNTGLTNLFILSLGRSGHSLFAGTQDGMFSSDNDGLTWVMVNNALKGNPVNFFSPYNSCLFSGSNINGIVFHEAGENSWMPLNDGLADTSVNAVIVSQAYAYAGTSGEGVWRRPLEQIFSLKVNPDTLLLSQFSGISDTLFINTSVVWSIIGTMPDWLSCESTSGNGEGFVVFRTLKPNLSSLKKYASLFLYSLVLPAITFTIAQKEKSAGITETEAGLIRVFPVPSTGIIKIESLRQVTSIMVYSAYGKVLYEINNPEQDLILDLSAECPGIYFLHFEGEKWSAIRKILILNK